MTDKIPLSKGVIVVTGAKGTGKTTLAATYAPPSMVDQVFYHDSERSANQIVQALNGMGKSFGYYGDLEGRFKDLPKENDLLNRISKGQLPWVDSKQRNAAQDYYLYILDDLRQNLVQGKYKVYVLDTLEMFEAGMAAWADSHKRDAGITDTGFGKFWTEGVFRIYRALITSIFSRGVETIILCSHLSTPWEDKHPIVNKVKPSGKKVLYLLSSLFLWMVHDFKNGDGAPAALVFKERLGKLTADDKEDSWATRRMLPRRIPHCTWIDIRKYLQYGCNLSKPLPEEVPNASEEDMISEFLNDAQVRLMVLAAEEDARRQETVSVFGIPPVVTVDWSGWTPSRAQERITELVSSGVTDKDKMREILLGESCPIPVALMAINQLGGG